MNQHVSNKRTLMGYLDSARRLLGQGYVHAARLQLKRWRAAHSKAPESTQRRWRCGQ